MGEGMNVSAVLLAAGRGTRMGTQTPKQFLPLRGKPVIAHTLSWLQGSPLIDEVVLVASRDRLSYCRHEIVDRYDFDKVSKIVSGKETRQGSARAGVLATAHPLVLIHDAVRPLLQESLVTRLLQGAVRYGAAAPALGLVDTVVRASDGFLEQTLPRDQLSRIQMPQAFRRDVVCQAQEVAARDRVSGATDEAQLVLRMGGRVRLVRGSRQLMKLTYPGDLAAIEYFMQFGASPDAGSVVNMARAVELVRSGEPIIISDSESRENEGDLFVPASLITPEMINFMVSHCRGLVCHTVMPDVAERLDLLPMAENDEPGCPAFSVTVDAKPSFGVSSGVSAFDRARTIHAVLNESTNPDDFIRPGHVFPIVARRGLLSERLGHTEASCYLAQLAGFHPSGVICEILHTDGRMARMPQLVEFGKRHGFSIVTIDALKETFDVQD